MLMQPKIIKPSLTETVRYGRRSFIRKLAFAAGTAAFALPNLITSRAYAGTAVISTVSGDNLLSLTNAAIARPFDVGTWTKLRVGIRLRSTSTGALTSVFPRMILGFQSGSADLILDATNTNFIGARTVIGTWSFSSNYNYFSSNYIRLAKRVSGTWTDDGALGGSSNVYINGNAFTANSYKMHILEITKGSPNYTAKCFTPVSTNVAGTRDDFLAQMIAATPSLTNYEWAAQTGTIAFDEADGTLDHVAFGWDRSEFAMQIKDIAISKIVL